MKKISNWLGCFFIYWSLISMSFFHVLLPMSWQMLITLPLSPSVQLLIKFFSHWNNNINSSLVFFSLLFPWMSSILWLIVRVLLIFGARSNTSLLLHPILRLCNYMDPFKIFVKVMTLSPFICRKTRVYLMN